MPKEKGLGKGLGALLGDIESMDGNSGIVELKISEIEPNKEQPRKDFDAEKLRLLADSIAEHGIIQPIVVKKQENGYYQMIAGERRWRAARLAGLKTVPVVIRDFEKQQMMEITLVENLQREDLNPIEEAEGYRVLMTNFGLTQDDVSKKIGKSRPLIANTLRLLGLVTEIKEMLIKNQISSGHARALLAIEEKEKQIEIAQAIINNGLNVRQTEQIVKNVSIKAIAKRKKRQDNYDVYFKELEKIISAKLGTKVSIIRTKNKGKMVVEYYSNEDLERIIAAIN